MAIFRIFQYLLSPILRSLITKNIEVNWKREGREGIFFQFYKREFVLQTNRRNSYCHTLKRTEQKREQKRVEVTSGLQILNIQYKLSSERARKKFPKQNTSCFKIDGWGMLPAKDISAHWSCQELSQPEQTAFWQLKPEVFPVVLPLPRWPWEYLPIRLSPSAT